MLFVRLRTNKEKSADFALFQAGRLTLDEIYQRFIVTKPRNYTRLPFAARISQQTQLSLRNVAVSPLANCCRRMGRAYWINKKTFRRWKTWFKKLHFFLKCGTYVKKSDVFSSFVVTASVSRNMALYPRYFAIPLISQRIVTSQSSTFPLCSVSPTKNVWFNYDIINVLIVTLY